MKNNLVKSLAAISLASGAYLSLINSASAAVLTGQFHFDGDDSSGTRISLSKTSFTFNPNPGKINIKDSTETFLSEGFTTATIKGLVAVLGNSGPNPFVDLGGVSAGDLTDGKNIFTISQVGDYQFTFDNLSKIWSGSIGFVGTFTGNNNTEISDGAGKIDFSMTNAQYQDFKKNKTVKVTFAGLQVGTAAAVPEASSTLSLLGLGVVGAVAVGRKAKKLEM